MEGCLVEAVEGFAIKKSYVIESSHSESRTDILLLATGGGR